MLLALTSCLSHTVQRNSLSNWPTEQWSKESSGIRVNLDHYRKGGQAFGSRVEGWHPATNEEDAASWTNVNLDGHHGIMFAKRPMKGKEGLQDDDLVRIYMSETPQGRSLERSGDIFLAPVKLSKHPADDDPDDNDEDNGDPDDDEESNMELERAFMPFLAWGAWSAYAAVGFQYFMASQKALMDDLEAHHHHHLATAKHITPLAIKLRGRTRTFTSGADLERFLPLAPLPLLFYPWGIAYGATFFAAAVDAVATTATAVSNTVAPFFFPFAAGTNLLADTKGDSSKVVKDFTRTWATQLSGMWGTWWWVALLQTGWWWTFYWPMFVMPSWTSWYMSVLTSWWAPWFTAWQKAWGTWFTAWQKAWGIAKSKVAIK